MKNNFNEKVIHLCFDVLYFIRILVTCIKRAPLIIVLIYSIQNQQNNAH